MKFKFLCHADKEQPKRACGYYRTRRRFAYLTVSAICKDDEEEAEHEAVTVIEPVGFLESVPDKVKGAYEEAEHEEHDKCSGQRLFTGGKLFGEKIYRKEQEGDHAAVNKRQTLRANGVIGAGEELREKVHKLKSQRRHEVRCGEGILAELERVVRGRDYDHRYSYAECRGARNAQK